MNDFVKSFDSFCLPQPLLHSIKRLNFKEPTDIQSLAIPVALDGRDILGSAQTGAGKTAAFGLPLLAGLLSNRIRSALVVTPTRELATQVMQALIDLLGRSSPIRSALLIGGSSIVHQFRQLRARPRLYVGTPGRINDHLLRASLDLKEIDFLVLDEADRMLDMGFSVQIEKICSHLPPKRQTLLFSATLPERIMSLASTYLHNPERISVGSPFNPAEKIKQRIVHVSEDQKYTTLLDELTAREGSVIVFVKTKYSADQIANRLSRDGFLSEAIHSDLRHNKRERVIRSFREKRFRVLVATDIAARGLDIPHIQHVINYDLPHCPEDYIHRIGRTARAGLEGEALCLVSHQDKRKWIAIECFMDPGKRRPPARRPSFRSSGPHEGQGRYRKERGGYSSPRPPSSRRRSSERNREEKVSQRSSTTRQAVA